MKTLNKLNLDKLGICTSAVCAVHCIVTPFLLLLFPLAGLAFLESEGFELGILALSLFFATASLAVSYLRNHRNVKPIVLAGFGFILFMVGKTFSSEIVEILFSVLGGSFLITAHYINIRLTRKTTQRGIITS